MLRRDPSTEWMRKAACKEDDQAWKFLDVSGDPIGERKAKEVCHTCPVAPDCLMYALTSVDMPYGIWGGTNELERTRLRRRLA